MGQFLLLIDRKPLGWFEHLEEAKQRAQPAISNGVEVTIESNAAHAPTIFWHYDHRHKAWAEDRQS